MAFVPSLPSLLSSPPTRLPLRSALRPSSFTTTRNPLSTLPSRSFLTTTPVAMLGEGQKAPDFSTVDTDGNTVALSDFSGSKLVIYFSAGAGPGCVSQSCSFRDAEAQFSALDAKIIAVTAQGKSASADFKSSNSLPFPVIPDPKKTLQKLYDIPATFGLIPGRVTYVIDRNGVVQEAYNSQFSVSAHIDIAKKALKDIA